MDIMFLEDMDLLEAVDLNILIREEVVNEASIAGLKVTKEKLQDEDFVKDLVKKIRDNDHKTYRDFTMLLLIVGVISTLTVVGAPIGILLIVIASKLKSSNELNEKDLKKLDDCFEKTIDKLRTKLSKTKDESKKKELKDVIKQLENNRERIYEKKEKAEIEERFKKLIDHSKYTDNGIKVGNTQVVCQFIDMGCPVEYAEKHKSVDNLKSEFKMNKLPFNKIEQFYANGIKTQDDLENLIKSKGKLYDGYELMGRDDSYGPTVTKYLKNKQVCVILTDVHDTTIVYSSDDKCCYDWIAEETNEITKISVKEFLQASKTAYEDLAKIIKEFKK